MNIEDIEINKKIIRLNYHMMVHCNISPYFISSWNEIISIAKKSIIKHAEKTAGKLHAESSSTWNSSDCPWSKMLHNNAVKSS